jgi:hypothetical protein
MVARVAIFEGVNVEAAQSTMEEAEAIIRPMLNGLAGYQGVTELAPPTAGSSRSLVRHRRERPGGRACVRPGMP